VEPSNLPWDPALGPPTLYLAGLLEAALDGDEAARTELIELSYLRARRLALAVLRDRFPDRNPTIQADEVISLAYAKFARLFTAGSMVPEDIRRMFGYIRRTIITVTLDLIDKYDGPTFRVKFPSGPLPEGDVLTRPPARAKDRAMSSDLIRSLDRLDEDDRDLIEARLVDQLSDEEIGLEFGIRAEDVGPRIDAIVRKLSALHKRGPSGPAT